jgi:hypothetical protein
MFQDAGELDNVSGATFGDTSIAITPDNGWNLVFVRAGCSAGSEGTTSTEIRATYAGTEIGVSEFYETGQDGHWNSNDFAMIKLVDTSGTDEVKIQAHGGSVGRSADVGAQQVLSIPLETMGLVEGVDYWYQEEYEGVDDDFNWDSGDIAPESLTSTVEISRLDWTAPDTEVYFVFWSCEAAMQLAGGAPYDGNYAIYQIYDNLGPKSVSSITESGGTATVTTVEDHGFSTNNWVAIEGADQSEYNAVPLTPFGCSHGAFKITVTGPKTFTYTGVAGNPDDGTGTITATRAPQSGPAINSHVSRRGAGGLGTEPWASVWCFVAPINVQAGAAFMAIAGKYWQGAGQAVFARRCRICVIKASSLTAGWGVGSQQANYWAYSDSPVYPDSEWNPNGPNVVGGATGATAGDMSQGQVFSTIDGLSQTYTPAGPGPEQTIVFANLATDDPEGLTYPLVAPLALVSYQIRDDTEGVNYAVDSCNPLIVGLPNSNVTYTFSMAVKDNNNSSATWIIQGREPNATERDVRLRNGRVVIMGLKEP